MADRDLSTTAAEVSLVTGDTLVFQPGTNQVLTDLKGWHSGAPIRRSSTPRLWGHGNFSERGWRDERAITVEGHFFGATRAEAAAYTDEANAALGDGLVGTFKVTDPDLGVRTASVFLDGTPDVQWDGGLDVFVTLELAAVDPRKYGEPRTYLTMPASPGGGLAFDLFTTADGLDFGAPGRTGTVAFSNEGTADTAPSFTISGPLNGFTLTEAATGNRLVYAGALRADDVLVLNTSDASVVLNGNADRSGLLTRREWTRISGKQTSTFLFEAPNSPNSTLTLGAAPAWW